MHLIKWKYFITLLNSNGYLRIFLKIYLFLTQNLSLWQNKFLDFIWAQHTRYIINYELWNIGDQQYVFYKNVEITVIIHSTIGICWNLFSIIWICIRSIFFSHEYSNTYSEYIFHSFFRSAVVDWPGGFGGFSLFRKGEYFVFINENPMVQNPICSQVHPFRLPITNITKTIYKNILRNRDILRFHKNLKSFLNNI